MTDEEPAVIEFATAGCKTMADDTLRLMIDIEPHQADQAFQMFGKRGLHGAIVRLNVDPTTGQAKPEEPEKPAHGKFWRDLIASGFFNAPPVLRKIGTEEHFEQWIREQPSVIDGNADWDERVGEGRCEPAHIRLVSEGSGTAEKPPYFAVPMTHKQHQLQHDKGYSAVTGLAEGEAAEWFRKKAHGYKVEWASLTLAETLYPQASSRGDVHPDTVRAWVEENDLMIYLPERLREG